MKIKIYNFEGKTIGETDIPDGIFARPWNPDLVHQALQAQESNQRKTIAHARTRAEARGGGIKPWRQKGTGRARHGSIRSPIWKGGGVSHGPTKEKVFSKKINKKMKRAALYSLLSKKLSDDELKVIDAITFQSGKTNEAYKHISKFLGAEKKSKKLSTLLVVPPKNSSTFRATTNIPKVKSLGVSALNVRDLLAYKYVLVDKTALKAIQ